jgi:hypothetical protein
MGIEPTGPARPELENKLFRAKADAKCDQRVNFRGMWGHVGQGRDASPREIPGSSLSVARLRSAQKRASRCPFKAARSRHSVPTPAQVQLTQHGPKSKMALLGLWQEHVRRKRELLFPERSSVAQVGSERATARNDL